MKRWLLLTGVVVAGIAGAVALLQIGDRANARSDLTAILDRAGDVQGELEACTFLGRPPPKWHVGAAAGAVRDGRQWWQACAAAALERFEEARAEVDTLNEPASEFRDSLMNFRYHGHPDKKEGYGATPAEICASVVELRRRYADLLRIAERQPEKVEEPTCEGLDESGPALSPAASPAPGVEYIDYVVRSAGDLFAHFQDQDGDRAIARSTDSGWQRLSLPEDALATSFSPEGPRPTLILRGSPQRIAALEGDAWEVVAELPDSLLAEEVRMTEAGPLVVARELGGQKRLVALRPATSVSLSPPVALTEPLSELPACDSALYGDGSVRTLCHLEGPDGHTLDSFFLAAGSDEAAHQRLTDLGDAGVVTLRTCASGDTAWALFGSSRKGESVRSLFASGDRGASWQDKGTIGGDGTIYCGGERLLWLGAPREARGQWQVLCTLEAGCAEAELLATVGRSYVAHDGSLLAQHPTGLYLLGDHEWALLFELGESGLVAKRLVRVDDREGVKNLRQLEGRLLRRSRLIP